MRVAIISYAFAEFSIQLANGLASEGEVLLLLPQRGTEEYESLLNPRVDFRPFHHPRLREAVQQLVSTAALVRQIRRFRPDVIHLQHGHLWFNLALPLLRRYPLVVTVHDPRHHLGDRVSQKTPQAIFNLGFRRADRVIVHGRVLKQQVVHLLGIPADRIHITPLVGIGNQNPQLASEAEVEHQVLFFGRLWKYKGLEYLIRAAPAIARAVPGVRIVIAGEGDDFEPYRRMMSEPSRFVIHNRYLSAIERDRLFRQTSVVVLPYVEATQSGVVPVAYSYSKPVVATNTGALSEAVEDGRTGRLVPPADPDALANAIIELLANPAKRRAMGKAGRHKFDSEWSPAAVAGQTLDVYRRAICDRTRGKRAAGGPDGLMGATDDASSCRRGGQRALLEQAH